MAGAMAEVVLFDLDGTLVDSAADLLAAMNRLRADEDLPPLPMNGFRQVVSRGGKAMLAVAYPERDEVARDALLPRFLAYYAEAAAVHSTPFEGVEPMLRAIEANGSRWGIVTNKPLHLARLVVAGMGWDGRCAVLVGGDSLPVKKPDPAPLLHACLALDIAPEHCVYVGDDERDIVAARGAGMKSVAALWGYRSDGDDPLVWRPDAAADQPLDLLRDGCLEALRGAA